MTPNVLRTKPTAAHCGFSIMTLHRLRKSDETFPKAIRLGTRAIGFRVGDLDAWLESRTEG